MDVNSYQSVVEIFTEATERFADKPAFNNLGKTISYRELDALTQQFAAWCQHEAGLKKGDRIAIMMPNLLQYPVAVFGALRAGLARAIVVVEAFASTFAEIADKTDVEVVITTRFGDMLDFPKSMLVNFVLKYVKKMVPPFSLPGSHSFKDVLAKGASLPAATTDVGHDDIAFLQYTGGTTGVAKGAMLTNRNMVANGCLEPVDYQSA